jgi:putative DNA primase/helicase
MEDDKVIQLELEVERMRIDAAVESLKGMSRAEQLEKCEAFEKKYPQYGKRLRERAGLVEPVGKIYRTSLRIDGGYRPAAAGGAPKPEPKPLPEPEEEEEPKKAAVGVVDFGDEQAKDDDGPILLSKGSPYDSAREFVRRHWIKDGTLGVYWWNEAWWEWNGRCYAAVSGAKINSDVWAFLDGARVGVGTDSSRYRPKPADVEGVVKALKAGCGLTLDPPCWLDGRAGGDGVLVFKNAIVDIETGRMIGLSPKLWTHTALDFDYDPGARCEVWDRFLGEVFEGDAETRDCIEEQLGLGMTMDVRFHKGFIWIGVQGREGKGTLAYVLEKLCGAYASLSFHSWLRGEYSAEALIGKKAGVFPDVRLKEGRWYGQNYDPGGIDPTSKEKLLRITGGDPDTVGRKWIGPWHGVHPMKVFLISNVVPNLNDPNLVSRFVKIAFNVSFRDREDLDLRSKLERELPGIAVRCLAAYRRLCRRGRFIQPASGLRLARELEASSNPWEAFIQDRCVYDPGGLVGCGVLYGKFEVWCEHNGRPDLLKQAPNSQSLGRLLRSRVIGFRQAVTTFREYEGKREYLGIRLKTKAERDAGCDEGHTA